MLIKSSYNHSISKSICARKIVKVRLLAKSDRIVGLFPRETKKMPQVDIFPVALAYIQIVC